MNQNGVLLLLRQRKIKARLYKLMIEGNHVLSTEKQPRQSAKGNERLKNLWMALSFSEIT
jgi:hypothetical protein